MENPRIIEDICLFLQQKELATFPTFCVLPYKEGLLLLYDSCIVHICLSCFRLKMAAIISTLPPSKASLLAAYFLAFTTCVCGDLLCQNQ
jgi:hypothetical protein